MARQITLELVGDADRLTKTMQQVSSDSKRMADKVEDEAGKVRQSFDKMGDGADASEGKFMGMADVLDGLGGAFGLPTEAATGMMRAFGDLSGGFAMLQPFIGGIGSALKAQLAPAMSLIAAHPMIFALMALAAAFVLLWKNSETFRDIVRGVFEVVGNAVSGVFDWVKQNWPLLLGILTGPIGLAVLAIVKHWDTISAAFTAVKEWIGARIGDIVGFFTELPGRLSNAAGDVFRFLRDLIDGAKQWVSDRLGDVVGFFTGIGGRIAGAAGDVFRFLRDLMEGAKNWVADRVTDVVTGWLNIGSRIAGAAGDVFRFLRDGIVAARDWVRDRIGDIVGFFTGLPGQISRAAAGAFDGLWNAFKGAINSIVRGWNGLDFKLPGIDTPFGKVGGFTLGTPDIPYLASGGIVTRPTLAVIGERGPEAVVPLDRAGAGRSVTVNVYGALDPNAVARQIEAILTRYERGGGTLRFR